MAKEGEGVAAQLITLARDKPSAGDKARKALINVGNPLDQEIKPRTRVAPQEARIVGPRHLW